MAKAASTAAILELDSVAQVIVVRVTHTAAASWSRSVTPMAWKAAVAAASVAGFTNKRAKESSDFGVERDGDTCVSLITYHFHA